MSVGKEKATHSCILAQRNPWTEEPGGLQSMGSQRVGHDWCDLARESIISVTTLRVFCESSWIIVWLFNFQLLISNCSLLLNTGDLCIMMFSGKSCVAVYLWPSVPSTTMGLYLSIQGESWGIHSFYETRFLHPQVTWQVVVYWLLTGLQRDTFEALLLGVFR